MHLAVPDTSYQSDQPQVVMIDQDPQAVAASVMAVLVRDETGQPFLHELVDRTVRLTWSDRASASNVLQLRGWTGRRAPHPIRDARVATDELASWFAAMPG